MAWSLLGVDTGGTNALIFSMQADTVDYGEWNSGIRAEGGSYSILSFIPKCGQGLDGWLGGAIIGGFGYIYMAAEQSDSAIIALLTMLLYRLDSTIHSEIIDELNGRRIQDTAAGQHGVSTGGCASTDCHHLRATRFRCLRHARPGG